MFVANPILRYHILRSESITMKPQVRYITFLFFLLSTGFLSAQNFYKEKVSRDNILTIGVGPSFAYLDNGGQYRDLNFEIRPSVSVALTRKMNSTFNLRSTLGFQSLSSGGNPSYSVTDRWYENYSSYTAKGPAFHFDLMPTVNLIRFDNHMHRSLFNLYGGLGLGVLHVRTKQTKSFSSDEIPTKHQITTGYVPVRAGLSYKIGPYADIAGEGTMLWTFSDNLDGNVNFNRFGDHLFQAQIVYRRYFVPKERD